MTKYVGQISLLNSKLICSDYWEKYNIFGILFCRTLYAGHTNTSPFLFQSDPSMVLFTIRISRLCRVRQVKKLSWHRINFAQLYTKRYSFWTKR